jgi:hypothetical protein
MLQYAAVCYGGCTSYICGVALCDTYAITIVVLLVFLYYDATVCTVDVAMLYCCSSCFSGYNIRVLLFVQVCTWLCCCFATGVAINAASLTVPVHSIVLYIQ